MQRFLTQTWLKRGCQLALMAGVFGVGVWSDLLRGRKPDFFDLQTALVAMLFAWLLSEFAIGAAAKAPKRLPGLFAWMVVVGVVFVSLAHAAPGFLVSLIYLPLTGFQTARSTIEGLFFTLRQTFMPALVCGALAGAVCGVLLMHARALPATAASGSLQPSHTPTPKA